IVPGARRESDRTCVALRDQAAARAQHRDAQAVAVSVPDRAALADARHRQRFGGRGRGGEHQGEDEGGAHSYCASRRSIRRSMRSVDGAYHWGGRLIRLVDEKWPGDRGFDGRCKSVGILPVSGAENDANRAPRYCALMPAALMIGHHLSISAAWKLARALGV